MSVWSAVARKPLRSSRSVGARVGPSGLVHVHVLCAPDLPYAQVAEWRRLVSPEQPSGPIGDEDLPGFRESHEMSSHRDRIADKGAVPSYRLTCLDGELHR